VDRLGVLGDLYALADLAFVGGGFHHAGLHSVLEPAAFGAGVLFGPRHGASRDARLLLDADAAMVVDGAAPLQDILARWLRGADDWRVIGERARAIVHEGLGAAERSYALVAELL
jgi:3-deoxy-D-manno-octulosonic-acid transferase